MAESVVSFALEKLTAFLIAEAQLLGSLAGDVRALGNELATIKEVLKDAEKRAELDDSINEWLRQVREIGYHIEDVIDEYVLLKETRQQQPSPVHNNASKKHGFYLMVTKIRKQLSKAVTRVSELKPKHELASKIQEIKAELLEINNRRERYDFITTTDHSYKRYKNQQDPQVYSLFMDDSELYGIEEHKSEIIKWLKLKQEPDDEAECARSVVPVVGMGGIGKTTLVSKVYEDKEVRQCFTVFAWVTVSPSYQWRDLLDNIYNQVRVQSSLPVAASDELTNIYELRKHLQDVRYIIVFDDVWDAELWRSVKAALPSNKHSSRILMTTRSNEVARYWMASLGGQHIYDLKPLAQDAAWDLFCFKTFGNGNCPSELKKVSLDIVEKCEGLPLAIVAIAGLLSTEDKVPSLWNKVYNSLGFELGSNRHFSSVTEVLLLSYHELPYYLKPCFLYFGMLPKAFNFELMRLIRLWIAEGFIQKQRGKTLEEVAEEYLNELVNRNLVLVQMQGIFMTRRKLFRVHDVLRETIILPKLDNLCFCQVVSWDYCPTPKNFRRISIHPEFVRDKDGINVSEMLISKPGVRSLICFARSSMLPDSSISSFAPFLKVLELLGSSIDHIPEELGILQHLRYLSLGNSRTKVLPKSIGDLRNLLTLHLPGCYAVELPREIGQCRNLRHLLILHVHEQAVKIHDGVLENLKELQELALVEAVERGRLIEELQYVKQLRRLAIAKVKKEQGLALCCAVEELKHLQFLDIQSTDQDEILDLQHITRPPPFLQCLCLKGRLEKLPVWVTNLNNLLSLDLMYSRLEDDPVKILQVLPNLARLNLTDAYVGEELDFGISYFTKLESVQFYDMSNLKSIVGGEVLPALERVYIARCPLLKVLPHSVKKLVPEVTIRTGFLLNKAAFLFMDAAERFSSCAK